VIINSGVQTWHSSNHYGTHGWFTLCKRKVGTLVAIRRGCVQRIRSTYHALREDHTFHFRFALANEACLA